MKRCLCPFFLFCSLYLTAFCSETEPSPLKSRSPLNLSIVLPPASLGNDPVVPYTDVTRYPVDRLKENDQEYTKYIENKKYYVGRSQQITRKLSQPNFMNENAESLKKWLELNGTSIWDAVRIIESPNFDGRQYKFLNELPHFYLKKRLLVPFEAFLKRFQYQNEMESSCESFEAMRITAPFTYLIFSLVNSIYLDDPTVDPFLTVLIRTQSIAFESCEWVYFDAWIRGGTSAWRYLKLYFDHSSSTTKSYSLVYLLTSFNYGGGGLVTFELMKFIISIESFDPNVRVPFAVNGTDLPKMTPFLHIVVLDSKYSNNLLPPLLTCKSLDTSVPTGNISLAYKTYEIVYFNEPIFYLAGALFNGWALLHLSSHDRIRSTVKISDFIIFLFFHFVKLIFLSFCTFIRKYLLHNFNKSSM